MNNRRQYERYSFIHTEAEKAKVELIVESVPARLVNFGLGGLYFLTERNFSVGEMINLSIALENKGKIDLTGLVVRTKPDPNSGMWGVAIDFSHNYHVKNIRKE